MSGSNELAGKVASRHRRRAQHRPRRRADVGGSRRVDRRQCALQPGGSRRGGRRDQDDGRRGGRRAWRCRRSESGAGDGRCGDEGVRPHRYPGQQRRAAAREAIAEMSYDEWREVMGVILDGSFHCVKACLPALRKSGAGAIINMGGMSAHIGSRDRAHVMTAKAALVGFSRALAHDLAADGVTANCVVPGAIATTRPSTRSSRRIISPTAPSPAARQAGGRGGDGALPGRAGRAQRHRTDAARQRRRLPCQLGQRQRASRQLAS